MREGGREIHADTVSKARSPCTENIITDSSSIDTTRGRDELDIVPELTNPNPLLPLALHVGRGRITMTHERGSCRVGRKRKRGSDQVKTPHSNTPGPNLVLIPRSQVPSPKLQPKRGEKWRGRAWPWTHRGISSHPLSTWRLSESARLKSLRQNRHLCNTGDVECTVS